MKEPAKATVDSAAHSPTSVSAVILHRVRDENTAEFLKWKRTIDDAALKNSKCIGAHLHAPVPGIQENWVSILEFNSHADLNEWMNSPEHETLVQQFKADLPDAEELAIHTVPLGLGAWFTAPSDNAPPGWKMALSVLFGLYPTVMLLTLWVAPFLRGLLLPVSMVISLALSVIILQWGVMPAVTALLGNWLKPTRVTGTSTSIMGAIAILLAIGAMVGAFSLINW